ncbi:hypothetical protein EJB05_05579 [Eragrostis curvula]|uniref:Auxin-responsive protein n=1 Tax=Eragrostis curvula TaxID=38414 RepID=A0A5J9WDI3_9POAL|nr:hypothetical protein EJB05_05579 [Eragrostis curvula]
MEATVDYMKAAEADNLLATELRLGLPGTSNDDHKATPPCTPRGKKRTAFDAAEDAAVEEVTNKHDDVEAAPPVAKAQVVGWPPVRSYRKSCFQQQQAKQISKPTSNNKEEAAAAPAPASNAATPSFVKVSMDGAPYLRKVDLRMYKGYRELREALEAMFVSSNNGGAANLSEFAVTYEDKDGDLMLVGDVPFEMFAGTCKKLRIMKRSEATGLGSPRQI